QLPLEPVWELAAWAEDAPGGVHQTQATSGEDWLYSITQSRTAAGVLDGFVSVGYSTYPTLLNTSCVPVTSSDTGRSYASIVKTSPSGEVEWFRDNGIEGNFWRVRNTSDGGFIAVGSTRDRNRVPYNPYVDPISGDTLSVPLLCWPGNGIGPRILIATKFN